MIKNKYEMAEFILENKNIDFLLIELGLNKKRIIRKYLSEHLQKLSIEKLKKYCIECYNEETYNKERYNEDEEEICKECGAIEGHCPHD